MTRARYRLEIFSSIRGDDFDLSKTDSLGVHLLKKYLDYAEKGNIILLQDIDSTKDGYLESPFEEAVYNALVSRGIKVKKQLGSSGYRIDLTIPDDEMPGRYILGIECDGASYHSSHTARDRDRLRQQILEDLGWNIYRIWSTDWFNNPKREFEKLLNAINKAKKEQYKKKVKTNDENKFAYQLVSRESSSNNSKEEIIPYSITPIHSVHKTDSFYYPEIYNISNVLKKVVDHESPVHKDEAARRVASHWGIKSVKSKIRQILSKAENHCKANGMIKSKGQFFWSVNMEKPRVRSRDVEGVIKNIEYISPEEIGEASLMVLKKEYSMPKNELVIQTAKLLGFARTTIHIEKYIWKCIIIYVENGKILEKNERLTFNKNKENVADKTTKDKNVLTPI